jgi:MFS family permease
MSGHSHAGRLRLWEYYFIEWLSSFAVVLFVFCVFFWAKLRFGYSDAENLFMGALQGFVAIFSTRYGGKLADRVGYERVLTVCVAMMALTMAVGWISAWRYTPLVVSAIYVLFAGATWPALEALILHCPGRLTVPNRLGLYNISWSSGNAIGIVISGALFKWNPNSIFWVAAVVHGVQVFWLALGKRSSDLVSPSQIDEEIPMESGRPISEKRTFMHLAWIGNGLAFLMVVGFNALVPEMAIRLNLIPSMAIWLSCALPIMRTVAFVICWRWEGWHYSLPWLQSALWLAPLSLGLIFFSNQIFPTLVGMVIFGLCFGLTYSGSLYYTLDYGHAAKGEHAGLHESIIGIGSFVGPLLAAGVAAMGAGAFGAQWTFVLLAVIVSGSGSFLILNRREKVVRG